MAWTQTKKFVQSRAGTTPYMCLANVRSGYGITNLLPDAWTAWQNTEQHKNRSIPGGVDVPLFYSFTATIDGVRKNYGHINVRLANGSIWNDGKIFANLATFEQAWGNVYYVGWGESVNNERVIKTGGTTAEGVKLVIEEQPPVFNAKYYLNTHKDVNKKYSIPTAKNHWLKFGIKEGRASAPNFHVKEYLANYGDLRKAFGDKGYAKAVKHYYNSGINEGRSGRTLKPSASSAAVESIWTKVKSAFGK